MIGKLILLGLRNSPVLATAAAVVWAGKKAYNYLNEKHVQALDMATVKKEYSNREMFPLLSYDFSSAKDVHSKIAFTKTVDDLDTVFVSYFNFEDVLVSIQKYQQSQKYTYQVYVDFVTLNLAGVTDFEQFGKDFCTTMGMKEDSILSFNEDIAKDLKQWLKNQEKKAAILDDSEDGDE